MQNKVKIWPVLWRRRHKRSDTSSPPNREGRRLGVRRVIRAALAALSIAIALLLQALIGCVAAPAALQKPNVASVDRLGERFNPWVATNAFADSVGKQSMVKLVIERGSVIYTSYDSHRYVVFWLPEMRDVDLKLFNAHAAPSKGKCWCFVAGEKRSFFICGLSEKISLLANKLMFFLGGGHGAETIPCWDKFNAGVDAERWRFSDVLELNIDAERYLVVGNDKIHWFYRGLEDPWPLIDNQRVNLLLQYAALVRGVLTGADNSPDGDASSYVNTNNSYPFSKIVFLAVGLALTLCALNLARYGVKGGDFRHALAIGFGVIPFICGFILILWAFAIFPNPYHPWPLP